ncbi:MAG: RNA polymerase sigma factor [Gammaproteobacteria bacterium]
MSRVADGEEAAFAQLYNSTSDQIYRYLKRLTGDVDTTDTLLLHTYQDAWQLADDYDKKLAPVSWLLSIARDLVLEYAGDEENDGIDDGPAAEIAAFDRQKVFIKAINSIPVESRDALALVLMHGYTYHAISEVMGFNIDEVKSRVFEAKTRLKEKLKVYGIKKHEVSKSNILRELIPLYINGALAGKHKIAFEKSLKNDPNLKQEYMEFYEIEAYFDQLNTASRQHLDQLYLNIINSLSEPDEPGGADVDEAASSETKVDFLHDILSSPQVGWGLAIVQFAILAVVLIFVVPQKSNSVEANISAAQLLQQTTGRKINVIFRDDATHQQIRDLLLKLDLQMFSGPTDIGLYTVSIDGSKQLAEDRLNKLRNSDIVVLADLAY